MATNGTMTHEAVHSICDKIETSPSKNAKSSPVARSGLGKKAAAGHSTAGFHETKGGRKGK